MSDPATPIPALASGGTIGYAFNAKTSDVTLFDPATLTVLATAPLGAVVRWLSNEQRFWDGHYVWTYDFPDNAVVAISIDPLDMAVAKTIPAERAGPAHSLMLSPDRQEAWVNAAGDDVLVVIDVATGQVEAEVPTGTFP